jgi:competence protein ComGC
MNNKGFTLLEVLIIVAIVVLMICLIVIGISDTADKIDIVEEECKKDCSTLNMEFFKYQQTAHGNKCICIKENLPYVIY